MAASENLKFGTIVGTMVTLILSVIAGTVTVYNHNEANTRELRELVTKNTTDTRALVRDNTEAIKDMISAFSMVQEANDGRLEVVERSRWSVTQESENAARNAIANPGIRYADPKNPGHFFFVQPLP